MTKITFYITSWFYHILNEYNDFKKWRTEKDNILELQIKKSLALSDSAKALNVEWDRLKKEKAEFEYEKKGIELSKENLSKDVIRLIRHNLSGDPLNTQTPESPEQDEGYFGEVNSLSKNKTLSNEINQLKKEFLENIAYEVDNLDWLNFNRARIDGLTKLTERLEQKGAEKDNYDGRRKKSDGGSPSESGGDDQNDSRQG